MDKIIMGLLKCAEMRYYWLKIMDAGYEDEHFDEYVNGFLLSAAALADCDLVKNMLEAKPGTVDVILEGIKATEGDSSAV